MEKIYEEAFTEVDEIFKLMPIDLLSKIPTQFRQAISENKATNYNVNIQEPLQEQDLKKETVVILGLIYRDFLASPEEREQLQLEDEKELKRLEQEMQEETDLVVHKEPNFIKKFFRLIKGIFNKNKF